MSKPKEEFEFFVDLCEKQGWAADSSFAAFAQPRAYVVPFWDVLHKDNEQWLKTQGITSASPVSVSDGVNFPLFSVPFATEDTRHLFWIIFVRDEHSLTVDFQLVRDVYSGKSPDEALQGPIPPLSDKEMDYIADVSSKFRMNSPKNLSLLYFCHARHLARLSLIQLGDVFFIMKHKWLQTQIEKYNLDALSPENSLPTTYGLLPNGNQSLWMMRVMTWMNGLIRSCLSKDETGLAMSLYWRDQRDEEVYIASRSKGCTGFELVVPDGRGRSPPDPRRTSRLHISA